MTTTTTAPTASSVTIEVEALVRTTVRVDLATWLRSLTEQQQRQYFTADLSMYDVTSERNAWRRPVAFLEHLVYQAVEGEAYVPGDVDREDSEVRDCEGEVTARAGQRAIYPDRDFTEADFESVVQAVPWLRAHFMRDAEGNLVDNDRAPGPLDRPLFDL